MLSEVHPKLPMRDSQATREFYTQRLGFELIGDYGDYLLLRRDQVELHFFMFRELDPAANYGQVYIRTDDPDTLHRACREQAIRLIPAEGPEDKPWGMREFALLDPDRNLLTFGREV